MQRTPNYNLLQYQVGDKFLTADLNDSFSKIDTGLSDLQETVNNASGNNTVTTNEVIAARKGEASLVDKITALEGVDSTLDTNKADKTTIGTMASIPETNLVQAILNDRSDLAEKATKVETQSQWINVCYPPVPLVSVTPSPDTDHCPNQNSAIQAIIDFCVNNINYYNTIFFPSGFYGITNLTIPTNITLIGHHCSSYSNWFNYNGTVLKDVNSTDTTAPLITYDSGDRTDAYTGRIPAGGIMQMAIQGAGKAHDAIHLVKTGLDFKFRDVFITNFKGSGVYMDAVFDMNIIDLTILFCGGNVAIDGSLHYALHMAADQGDCTNACHFFALHIECCRYALNLYNCRHNQFIACKFEMAPNVSVSTDITNPNIVIGALAWENEFISCMFPAQSVEEWLAVPGTTATTAQQTPYMIQGVNATDGSKSHTRFIGCDFANGHGIGAKYIKSNSHTMTILGCHFDYGTGKDYCIDLGYSSKFCNNTVFMKPDTDGVIKGIQIADSTFSGNTLKIYNPNSYTITSSVGLTSWGSTYTRIGNDNLIYGFGVPVIMKNAVEVNKPTNLTTISDAVFSSLWPSATDKNNFTLDLNGFFSKQFYFGLTTALNIVAITNGFPGEQITIWNNTANAITLTGGSTIRLTGGNTTRTLVAGDFITLRMITSTLFAEVVTSYNHA